MTTKHLMIDLETYGINVGSMITQIGYCSFTEHACGASQGNIGVRTVPQQARGFTKDPATLVWWKEMEMEAELPFADQYHPEVALKTLKFISQNYDFLWAWNKDFDFAHLNRLFTAFEIKIPWSHKQLIDGTSFHRMGIIDRPDLSNAHNGQADAVGQAQWASKLLRCLSAKGFTFKPL